jgi:hypothetical protein
MPLTGSTICGNSFFAQKAHNVQIPFEELAAEFGFDALDACRMREKAFVMGDN